MQILLLVVLGNVISIFLILTGVSGMQKLAYPEYLSQCSPRRLHRECYSPGGAPFACLHVG